MTAPEPVADTVRRAAKLLRERAQVAARGPWHVELLGAKGYPQRISNAQAIVIAQTYTSPVVPPVHAEYIAAMHPAVALAVADSWEHQADDMADNGAGETRFAGKDQVPFIKPVAIDENGRVRHDWTATLAAARALLGEA